VSTPIGDLPRRVIPRWRDFRTTAALGELSVPPASPSTLNFASRLDELLRAWADQKNDPLAAEVLAASWLEGRSDVASETAHYILRTGSSAHPISKEIARHILEQQVDPASADATRLQQNPARPLIRALRDSLRRFPENAIGWCELARYYVSIGKDKAARRAILTAIRLAPNDRYVLRSAARCFIHLKEPELALQLVTDAERTKSDPWLLAAHVSISNVVETTPRFFRLARQVSARASIPSFHNSELLASLGTLEVFSGNDKKARKLLTSSLRDPTENVVAKAWWAHSKVNLNPPVNLLDRPRSFEANTRALIQTEQWEGAIKAGREWLNDEPFSRRPAIETSFLLGAAFADHEGALEVLKRTLPANGRDPLVLNNLAFTYASLGRTKEARAAISLADRADATTATLVSLTATEGLIHFRESRPEEGREKYLGAMEFARVHSLERQRAMASVYLAMQEKAANTEQAQEATILATSLTRKFDDPVCKLLLEVLANGPKKLAGFDRMALVTGS
jgi:tetratricopeptide (TPR) repeat protein